MVPIMQRMRRLCLLVRCRATPWASQARILGVLLARPLLLAHTPTHGLTMFATRPRPSRRRDKNWGFSWGTRTLRIFASIAPSSGRQHDPQHEAGMWQSRVLAQLAVLDATNSQSCISYEDNVSLLSSVLVSTRKAAHVQSSPAVPCRVSNPGSLRGDTVVYPYCRV